MDMEDVCGRFELSGGVRKAALMGIFTSFMASHEAHSSWPKGLRLIGLRIVYERLDFSTLEERCNGLYERLY